MRTLGIEKCQLGTLWDLLGYSAFVTFQRETAHLEMSCKLESEGLESKLGSGKLIACIGEWDHESLGGGERSLSPPI